MKRVVVGVLAAVHAYWYGFLFAVALSASVNLFTSERIDPTLGEACRIRLSWILYFVAALAFAACSWWRQQVEDDWRAEGGDEERLVVLLERRAQCLVGGLVTAVGCFVAGSIALL